MGRAIGRAAPWGCRKGRRMDCGAGRRTAVGWVAGQVAGLRCGLQDGL